MCKNNKMLKMNAKREQNVSDDLNKPDEIDKHSPNQGTYMKQFLLHSSDKLVAFKFKELYYSSEVETIISSIKSASYTPEDINIKMLIKSLPITLNIIPDIISIFRVEAYSMCNHRDINRIFVRTTVQ